MQKNRHLRTIAHLCRAISSQLRHVSPIGKKLVKQQYLPHMSLQYGELRPTSGWDRFVSLGHPSKFQRVRVLAALLHSQTAALNRGCHLYSAGRPSRWALAHISSSNLFETLTTFCKSLNVSIWNCYLIDYLWFYTISRKLILSRLTSRFIT